MKSFTDNNGQTWIINVNVGALKRVKSLCDGLNLLNVITFTERSEPRTDVLDQISSDPVLLVDVLYAICKPEADAKGINDEAFGAALSGDVIEYATKQLLEAIVDFFPEAKRKVCQKIIMAANRFAEKQKQILLETLESPEMAKIIDSQLEELSVTSMNALESAE